MNMTTPRNVFTLLCLAMIPLQGGVEAQEAPVRIGLIHPLSGPLAPYGKSSLQGVRMRMDELDAAGGIGGRRIELVIEDDKGDATQSIHAFNKLAGTDKVVAIIAPITSTNALAVRPQAKKLMIPAISPTATNDKVTLKNPFMFRACFTDSFQGVIIAGYARKELKAGSAAVMKDINSDYSKGLCASFIAAFRAGGGTIAAEEGYQQGDTDFGTQLKKIKESKADIVFVPGYPPEVPLIIKQAKVLGLDAKLCGADGWDDDTVVNGSGDSVEGCFLVGAFSREDKRAAVQDFVRRYTEKYGSEPGTFGALGYDTVSLLAEAMKNGVTPENIRHGLAKIRDFEAVTGRITMTDDGDAVKPAVILEIARSGAGFAARYKATVSPDSIGKEPAQKAP